MRLFVAVDPDSETVEAVARAAARLRPEAPSARWQGKEKFHLTLVFLGSMDETLLPRIEASLAEVAARHAPFSLTVEDGGSFGPKSHPRVLWAGIGGEVEALAELAAATEEAMVEFGHEPERRDYHAHLTLARAAHPRGDPALATCAAKLNGLRTGPFRVGELVLYRSQLSPKGSTYEALAKLPLRA